MVSDLVYYAASTLLLALDDEQLEILSASGWILSASGWYKVDTVALMTALAAISNRYHAENNDE